MRAAIAAIAPATLVTASATWSTVLERRGKSSGGRRDGAVSVVICGAPFLVFGGGARFQWAGSLRMWMCVRGWRTDVESARCVSDGSMDRRELERAALLACAAPHANFDKTCGFVANPLASSQREASFDSAEHLRVLGGGSRFQRDPPALTACLQHNRAPPDTAGHREAIRSRRSDRQHSGCPDVP